MSLHEHHLDHLPSLRVSLYQHTLNAYAGRKSGHTDFQVMSVTLHTTHGDVKVELFCQACPKTTYNFLALCASGEYDGSPFHRLIPNCKQLLLCDAALPSARNEYGMLTYDQS